MKYFFILAFICFCSLSSISAQEPCGSHEYYLEQMKNNPEFRKKQEEFKRGGVSRSTISGVVKIPTVFHVIYNNEAENISDEQIYSQLEVLNEDFNLLNTNIDTFWSDVIGNPEMEFCLATRDILGNATCGITRTYTDSTIFRIQTSPKDESTGGISGWDARYYLNVFICDIANVRGYATFPDAEDSIDGIVIDYLSFGRGEEYNYSDTNYSLGRTGTHEVGHWLRLSHIWGDGGCDIDDGISDTPSAAGPNYNCNVGSIACRGDSLNMVQNYMDYSDDDCMYLFTQGQIDLMRKAFDTRGSRVSILSSKGCQPPGKNEIFFKLVFDQFPEDLSWELRDSSNSIIASDGNYAPGDYINLIPAPLAYDSLTYPLDLPDGAYSLHIYDSYGDGFPLGGYEIKTRYDEIVIAGDGNFTDSLSIPFTLSKAKYRFLGTQDNDWYNKANWNRKNAPSDCYQDEIIIEAPCVVDSIYLKENRKITILNNATLSIEE